MGAIVNGVKDVGPGHHHVGLGADANYGVVGLRRSMTKMVESNIHFGS